MFAEVNFRLAGGENPLIVIPASVNGRGPFEFILDTGAGTSLLSPGAANELGIEATGTREGFGAAGKVTASVATIESLAIGGARQGPMTVAITAEMDRIGNAVGARIHGDLGYDFLKNYRVSIDYVKNIVRLAQGAYDIAGTGPLTHSEVAFRLAHPSKPLALVPAMVNGRGPYTFAVDTGASVTSVSPGLASALAIATSEPTTMTGAGGRVQASVGRVRSLAVGSAALDGLSIMVSGFLESISQVVGAELDGIIGYNFLRRFRVTLDYPNSVLHLVKV